MVTNNFVYLLSSINEQQRAVFEDFVDKVWFIDKLNVVLNNFVSKLEHLGYGKYISDKSPCTSGRR